MKFIDVIEELSHSKSLHQGDIYKFSKEVLKTASKTLGCQRTNAWLFNEDKTILRSIQSFDASKDQYSEDTSLEQKDLPNYFNFLTKNKIIVSDDALSEKMNAELLGNYLIPNGIKSMIDVPLRSEGEMVGLICFEAINQVHEWTNSEMKFTQSLAQLLSLAIETNQKNIYRKELEKTIQQKEVLLSEINHRVKNNMAVIIGLINLQRLKAKDEYHDTVLEELKGKIYSMAIVQNHLHNNRSLVKVELGKYLEEVIQNLNSSYGHGKDIQLDLKLEKAVLDITAGIPIGLIANEVLTNSFKYAFNEPRKEYRLKIVLHRMQNKVQITFKDNGPGFDAKKVEEGMGMELIRDLTEQIGGTMLMIVKNGVEVQIQFPIA